MLRAPDGHALMRRPLLWLALGAVALSAWYYAGDGGRYRHTFAHAPCAIPVHYRLDEIDPRFGFDRLTVTTALIDAVSLWQSRADALLFVESDHPEAMRVSMRFDHRQESANVRSSLRGGLEQDRVQLERDEAMLARWATRIEEARAARDRAADALRADVAGHEARVAAWNAGEGERSERRRRALETERETLRLAGEDVRRMTEDLNGDIAAYNRAAADMQRRVADFRGRVGEYNQASSGELVESGRYQYAPGTGRRIDVFRVEDYEELVRVLAHELGHALGLGHVEQPGALMHAMLHRPGAAPTARSVPAELLAADLDALQAVCGERLDQAVH